MKAENEISIGDMVTHKVFGSNKLFGTVLEIHELIGRALVYWHNYTNQEKKRYLVEIKDLKHYEKNK